VVGFIAKVVAMMFALVVLGTVASLAMLLAVSLGLPYAWKRLTPKGRILFGTPAACLAAACVLFAFELPGATVLGWVAFVTGLLAVVLGTLPRKGLSTSIELTIAASRVDPMFLRSEAPTDKCTLMLDARTITLGPDDVWPRDEVATARFWRGKPGV